MNNQLHILQKISGLRKTSNKEEKEPLHALEQSVLMTMGKLVSSHHINPIVTHRVTFLWAIENAKEASVFFHVTLQDIFSQFPMIQCVSRHKVHCTQTHLIWEVDHNDQTAPVWEKLNHLISCCSDTGSLYIQSLIYINSHHEKITPYHIQFPVD
jgi:hypothetical protein